MTKETIETIRFALQFLKGVNETIVIASNSIERSHKAYEDIQKDKEAIAEFEAFVIRHVLCGAEK